MAVELNRVTTTPTLGDLVLKPIDKAAPIPPGWTMLHDGPAPGSRLLWRRCVPGDVWRPGMVRIDGLSEEIPWAAPPGTTYAVWLDA